MNILHYINKRKEQVETSLRDLISIPAAAASKLSETMCYSLLADGKRLRPILVFAAAEAISEEEQIVDDALNFACAIEMIHTYSLIHDDLPAMDNDDYRRGRLTSHKVFGEAMAILAGDGLLTHAFYVAANARSKRIEPQRVLTVMKELSQFAGISGMVGGQVLDILGDQKITSLEQLEKIHTYKTSELIVCALRTGGHVAQASCSQLQALTTFGRKMGLAFQIQDDILDVIGNKTKLGKQQKSDERMHKVTYPFLIGLEESQKRMKQLFKEATLSLNEAHFPRADLLHELAAYLMKRDH